MAQGVTKSDLEKLSQAKLDDAMLLSSNGRHSNAYYLGGYAVELALKACIAGRMSSDMIPDKKFINAVYTHVLDELIGVAGLRKELKDRQDADPEFHAHWGLVTKWSPESRYESRDSFTCQIFLQAVGDQDHGVFEWIKSYW